MKNVLRSFLLAILVLAVPSALEPSGGTRPDTTPASTGTKAPSDASTIRPKAANRMTAPAQRPTPREAYGKLPMQFEENRGQTDSQVKYLARGRGYIFFVTPQETVLAFRGATQAAGRADLQGRPASRPAGFATPQAERSETVLRFVLEGANTKPRIEGAGRLPSISNYFIGNDPAKWRTNIPNYAKIVERNVYPGIDAAYYGKEGRLESDFIVAPGRNPGAIRLKITGALKAEVNSSGDLVLATAAGDVKLEKPVLYQMLNGSRREVEGAFRLLSENEAGFTAGPYDHRLPLVIDPTLSYSTYLGGSGNSSGFVSAIAVDSAGEAYVTGDTTATDFPLQNPEQGAPGAPGATTAFVTKFSASGTSLVYSTYLGGSGSDRGMGIAVDAAGEAYITGGTQSSDFPRTTPTSPGLNGIEDAFVTKLSASGAALVFSFYLGGELDDFGRAIAVDSAGNAYVTGFTDSMMFPVTGGVIQTTLNGSTSAFATKVSAAGTVTWSTYLGGNNSDQGAAVAVDGSGNVYLAGFTDSSTFPTKSPIQANLGSPSAENAFITELNPTATALVYSTYLGGSFGDTASGIAVDASGNTIIVGSSGSPDFPTLGSLQGHDNLDDLFVAKIAPGGASLVFATLFGDSSGSTSANAVALDSSGNIYVTGRTNALFFPTLNPLQATTQAGHFTSGFSDDGTAFVVEFKSDGSDYLFSTFLGGSQDVNPNEGYIDEGFGIAVDATGNIYLAGISETADFPTVNPFQGTLLSVQSNGFVAKISPATPAGPQVFPATLNLGSPFNGGPSTRSQIVTIANGTNTLNFTGFTFAGANPGDFSEADSCGPTLLPHVVCTVVVTATPSALGARSATLQINDSDVSSPQVISLTATGTASPPPPTGTLTISPMPSLPAFGPQELSTPSATQTITVSNTGTTVVNFNFSTIGTDPSDFNVFGTGTTCNGTLAGGANCAVAVFFEPTAVGSRTASANFTGNFTGSPASVGLSGTGTPNQAMLNPTFLNFSNQVVNTTSAAQTITLTNTSTTAPLTSIVISPPGAPFAIATNTCGASLAPSASCNLGITFTPTTAGFTSGSFIRVTSSDPVPSVLAFLSGNGLNPAATLAPLNVTILPFARQAVGTTSPAQDLILQNIGNTALVFTATITGANPTDFGESDLCSATIPPGGFCFVSVTFTPGALGGRAATLTFNSTTTGATGVPQAVMLSGTGVTATTAAVAPTSLLFPNEPVDSTSPPQLVTFSNTGNRQLSISSVSIGGANPTDFQFTFVSNGAATIGCSGGFSGAIYNPDVACPISFTFTPTANGPRSATFTIVDSASNSPQTVLLQGMGGNGPAVMLAPVAVAFGTVTQGTTSSPMVVTLTNTGTSPLMFAAAPGLSGTNAADFGITATTCAVATPVAASGGSCTVTLTFTPSTVNIVENATLTFADNATPATQTVPLSGTGTTAPAPAVTFSPTSVAFGAVNVGTPSTPVVVTLTNSGTAALTIVGITITGANAADFMQTNNCPTATAPLAAGAACMITLTFTPAAAGNEAAILQVADNAAGSPQMVPLSGTGSSTAAGFTFTAMTPGNGGIGTNVSILPGDTAVFTLVLQPNPGFIGPIAVACVSTIPFTIATASPAMINVTTTPSPPFTIMCTLQTNCVPSLVGPRDNGPRSGPWGAPVGTTVEAMSAIALLIVLLMALLLRRAQRPWAVRLAPALLLVLLLMTWTACVHNDPPVIPNAPTTPAGVYQIQVVATAPGGVKQTVSLTVHVI
jgi:hypothetical protein